jgi:hypothetical protein
MLAYGASPRIPPTPTASSRSACLAIFCVSEDAGAFWRKIAREFGEISVEAWLPNWRDALDVGRH